jgi:hypothetical protein
MDRWVLRRLVIGRVVCQRRLQCRPLLYPSGKRSKLFTERQQLRYNWVLSVFSVSLECEVY